MASATRLPASEDSLIQRILDEAERATQTLPSELECLAEWQTVQGFLERNKKDVRILVTGKTGNGKSTLVNGLVGKNVAKESKLVSRKGETTGVVPYCCPVNDINVTVYDSPGLQDADAGKNDAAYLADMAATSSNYDLSIFCLRMIDNRLTPGNPDVITMKKLTELFGEDYWKRTVIVLTFANSIESIDIEMQVVQDPEQKNLLFHANFEDWKGVIRRTLMDDLHISRAITESIPIIPAGHHRIPKLFDQEFWLSQLWLCCFLSMSKDSPEAASAFLHANKSRIISAESITDDSFSVEPEDQPLVLGKKGKTHVLFCLLAAIATLFHGRKAFVGRMLRRAFKFMYPNTKSMTYFQDMT